MLICKLGLIGNRAKIVFSRVESGHCMCGKCLSVLAFAEKTDKTNDILSGTVICIMLAGETGPSVEKEMRKLKG